MPDMADMPDGRSASRFMAGLPASFQLDGVDIPCRAHNLSRSGVLLVGQMPAISSSEIWLTIASPNGDLQLTTAGRVIRCDTDPDEGRTTLGIEFVAVSRDDRPTLEALVARVVEGLMPGSLEELPATATPEQIRLALDQIPLHHRTALAVRARPREREVLIRDRQIQVIDALARNPNLLPREVITLLRMPNLMPTTLETIGRDTRWIGNEHVMVLVATHRNAPLPLAEQILSRMSPAGLQRAIRAPSLRPVLRDKILRRLPRGHR